MHYLELVIKKKLLVDERLLKRISKHMLHCARSDGNQAEVRTTLVGELELLELGLLKLQRSLAIAEEEISYYEDKHRQIEREIAAIKEENNQLEQHLAIEQQRRQNKDAYDVIAQEILKFPPRDALLSGITEMETEMDRITKLQNDIQTYIDSRAMAAYDMVRSLRQLKGQVEFDLASVQ
jgi:chromosome segregation ATPase